MKAGIDNAGLVKHSLMLLALITLDSRGGFFGHTNMAEAIKTLVNNEKKRRRFQRVVCTARR